MASQKTRFLTCRDAGWAGDLHLLLRLLRLRGGDDCRLQHYCRLRRLGERDRGHGDGWLRILRSGCGDHNVRLR
jgi:hypothetical protein